MSLITFLKSKGWLPMFGRAMQDEAGDEDVMRAKLRHDTAARLSERAAELNHQANGALRDAVRRVRSSNVFGDFERSVRRDR